MSLYQTVEPSLLKLKRRLTKEGIRGLSHMDYEKYLRTVFWKERIGSRKNRVRVEWHLLKFNRLKVLKKDWPGDKLIAPHKKPSPESSPNAY